MSFQNLSAPAFLAGVPALAAGLFLLQRLRVRYQPKRVVTTLFWREALEDARARVFVRRFRHLPAYLFILLIASLLWLGFADPRGAGAQDEDHVILVDGSAGMAHSDRFQRAVDAARDKAAALPRGNRTVLLCGGRVRPLLMPEEHERVFDRRSDGLSPEACPSTLDATLRAVIHSRHPNRRLSVTVVGDGPVDSTSLELLPEDVSVSRLDIGERTGRNSGVVDLGVSPASSGAWDRVDVIASISGDNTDVSVTLDGRPLGSDTVIATRDDGGARLTIKDLDATGALLELRLPAGDPLALDDVARLRLPKRPKVRVQLSPSLATVLRPVLVADPGVVLVDSGADVAVRRGGEDTGGAIPALEWTTAGAQTEAILLRHEKDQDSERVLLESFDRLGLEEVDTTELANTTEQVISLGATPAERRGVSIWDTLLSDQYNFVHSRSFPLLVGSSLRWLAGVEPFPPYVAAGEPVAGDDRARTDAQQRTLDPAGTAFVPPVAGAYTAAGEELVASLLDPATTVGAPSPGLSTSAPPEAGATDPLTWIVLVAVLLICAEWVLYRSGRMP